MRLILDYSRCELFYGYCRSGNSCNFRRFVRKKKKKKKKKKVASNVNYVRSKNSRNMLQHWIQTDFVLFRRLWCARRPSRNFGLQRFNERISLHWFARLSKMARYKYCAITAAHYERTIVAYVWCCRSWGPNRAFFFFFFCLWERKLRLCESNTSW